MKIRSFVERRYFGNEFAVYFASERGEVRAIAQPVTFRAETEGEFSEPCLRLDERGAQELMDELWRAGLRPSEGTGSAGSLAATERHLKDMQQIAFGALRKVGAVE